MMGQGNSSVEPNGESIALVGGAREEDDGIRCKIFRVQGWSEQ